MRYVSTKTYGHDIGLSACFRQWRADSHCHFLHGYALAFRFEFEATELDARNWVVDFGSLKPLKQQLEAMFDHKTVVADDDPLREWFVDAHNKGAIDLRFVPATGCEKFAEIAFRMAEAWLDGTPYANRVRVRSVECREHGANSAIAEAA